MERLTSTCDGRLVASANAADGDPTSDPLEQLSYQETRQLVTSMITCLSPVLAEALRLRFIEGLPLDEAAMLPLH